MKTRAAIIIVLLALVCCFTPSHRAASTLVVTKTEDTNDGTCDADCSLREAVVAARSGDTVLFSNLFNTPRTITLTLGEMAFSKDLTVTGTGRNNLIISANNASRIFYVSGAGHLSASGMTLRDGNVGSTGSQDAFGGAILLSDSFLDLTDVLLTNNRAFHQPTGAGAAGAIYGYQSNISLTNVSAIANTRGGAIIATPTAIGHLMGDVDMIDSEIKQNVGGGVGADTLTVGNCVVSGNSGGLGLRGNYTTISDSEISDNGDVGILGGDSSSTMSIERSIISGNRSSLPGGGLFTRGFTVIRDSQFVNNIASRGGGGIFNTGELYVISSSITGNISNASFSGVDGGGGITTTSDGILYLINSTVSGNSAFGDPGVGGGVYVTVELEATGRIVLVNSTIANNTSMGAGGGIRIDSEASGMFTNAIVSGNTSTLTSNEDISGGVISKGHNLIGNTNGSSGWRGEDILNQNALLAPLGNNGRSTFTHALLPGSPAINAGSNALAIDPLTMLALTVDQRGFERFIGGGTPGIIDIGAYEALYSTSPVTVGGRVVRSSGRGVDRARIKLDNGSGSIIYTQTNSFGYYRFLNLTPGTTYTITVTHKSNTFTSPQFFTADQDREDLNFIAINQ